jgi:hypothetical protein
MSSDGSYSEMNSVVARPIAVRAVVRAVVEEVAPEELPVIDGLAVVDDDTAAKLLSKEAQREEPLGFGVGEVVVMVTPLVWAAVNEASRKLAVAAGDGTARGVQSVVKKISRRRKAKHRTIAPLSADQLAWVQEQVVTAALDRGFGVKKASVIADAVVSKLALMPSQQHNRDISSSGEAE